MLTLLLACAGSPLDSGPTDTVPEFPTWSGTQIGEEGDEGCTLEGSAWDDEQSAPPGSDLTPAEVRAAMGGDFSGILISDWQGEADLSLTVTLDGPAQALTDTISDCAPALGLSGTFTLSAGELLVLETPIDLVVQGTTGSFWDSLSEPDLSGDLSPGILPDDAEGLSLQVMGGFIDGAWLGALDWHLSRPTGTESASAATWNAE